MNTAKKEILEPWCIAIIDDSPEDCAEIRRMLLKGSDRRLSFIEAGTAQAGIQSVLGATPKPDCVVLDYNLPEMDAPEVLAALTGADGMPLCPVVVVTGGTNREQGRRALRSGAQDYIGKDWTSPASLSRAVENARETWAMARELRQRKNDLRLIIALETFRSLLIDALRDLSDESAAKRVVSQLLGSYLNVNRVMYGEVNNEGCVVMGQGFARELELLEGKYCLSDFDSNLLVTLAAGQTVVITDLPNDDAYSESEKARHAQLGIVAGLGIPVMRGGRLAAVLSVQQKTARDWTSADIAIAREVAERTWTAVSHARVEKKLRSKDFQLSQMMEMMPSFSALLTGPTFIFEMANQSYFDLVGRGAEIIGKTVLQALPEIADQPFPALLEEVYRTGKPFEAKAMIVKLPRGPHHGLVDIFIDFAYLPLRDADGHVCGIFIHGLDRTAEMRITQALAQRERELRSVTENTPDVLARFDGRFRHLFVNSVVEKITGRTVAEIVGKTNRELGMPEQLCDKWDKALRHVFDHGVSQSFDFSFPTLTGMRQFSCRLVPEFNEHARVETVLGVTHDITTRCIYEQRLVDQDLRKDMFLATLAHELRNPLAPIRSGLQLLKLSPQTDLAMRTLPVMERQLGQLVCLIDDLLDVSRISTGKIVLKRECITFQEAASAALEASRPVFDAAGHSVTIDWPAQPVWLDADLTRLTQIFSNLLTNAAKYTQPGGQIRFSARLQQDNISISVADTGMGIPGDMLDAVFDMFTQVNRTLDRAQGGLGIGLSLVKTLVNMHGGSVQAASGGIDLGSEFTVTLPTTAGLGKAPAAATRPVTAPVTAHRILVVDDNVDAAETMAMLLELSGHAVRTAFSGQQALDVALEFCPEVVFLDIGLPDMNGHEVARRLLANAATADARLIALTGWGTEEDIRKSHKTGFHEHLTKPVDPETVENLIAGLLAGRKAL